MRYCTNCRRVSAGTPPFCTRCGRTYHVRLCPRLHVNGRRAEVCSQCGSRDLTQPAARAGLSDTLLGWALHALPVAIVVIVPCLVMLAVVHAVLVEAHVQGQLVAILLLGAVGWWAWQQLPGVVRSGARTLAKRIGKRRTPGGRH